MYMSRARLLYNADLKKALWKNMGNVYNVHQLVWKLFSRGEDDKRRFLYRQDMSRGGLVFYFVSEDKPYDDSNIWMIDSKQYNPVLKSKQRLAFSLRANPIVSKRDEDGKQHRHDVIMNEKVRIKKESGGVSPFVNMSEIVQDRGVEWLKNRAEKYGFSIDSKSVRADGYQGHKFYKANGKRYVSFNTIDYTGILMVTEPERLKSALFEGIGPAKGFGCGLFLIRPIN